VSVEPDQLIQNKAKKEQERTSRNKHIGKVADWGRGLFRAGATKRCLLCSLGLGIFGNKIGSRGGPDGTA
jgi:hypothetical protein